MGSYLSPKFVVQTAFLVTACYLCTNFVAKSYEKKTNNLIENENEIVEEKWNQSFEGFNNTIGADRFIVPNIIHFIRFNQTEYSLIDYVVIKAAMRNHRPDFFYIHTDVIGPGNFTGRYWELIKKDYEIWSRIRLFHLEAPSEIFGQNIKPGDYFIQSQNFEFNG